MCRTHVDVGNAPLPVYPHLAAVFACDNVRCSRDQLGWLLDRLGIVCVAGLEEVDKPAVPLCPDTNCAFTSVSQPVHLEGV